jgi:hypothetical protein
MLRCRLASDKAPLDWAFAGATLTQPASLVTGLPTTFLGLIIADAASADIFCSTAGSLHTADSLVIPIRSLQITLN